jgi:AcrR family transcriptional regulator
LLSDEEYRARILSAATQVIAKAGPEAAKVADIARVANVSYGQLYHRFPNREALLVAAMREQSAIVERDWSAATQLPDPMSRIVAVALAPVRRLDEVPGFGGFYFFMQPAGSRVDEVNAESERMANLGIELVADCVAEAQRLGCFANLDPHVTAVSIMAIPMAYVAGTLASDSIIWSSIEIEITKLITALSGQAAAALTELETTSTG